MKNPKVFISYSWDNQEHANWVIAFTNELRKNGIDANIDRSITQDRTVNLNKMMIEEIRDSDYTLIILTDKYAQKAELFEGGVGYETSLLTSMVLENVEKIIPIIKFKGDIKKAIPFYLKGLLYIDFSDEVNFFDKFEELKHKIFKINRIEMESLGKIPDLKPKKVTMDTLKKNKNFLISDELIPDFSEIRDIDKNKFMKKSYTEITEILTEIAKQTKEKNNNFDYTISEITKEKMLIRYYVNGSQKYCLKIWLEQKFSKLDNIFLFNGNLIMNNDNSFNNMISCEVDRNKDLKLIMTVNLNSEKKEMNSNDMAIEIWKNIMKYFN